MKTNVNKLDLNVESLRELTIQDLPTANGGDALTNGPACTVVFTLTTAIIVVSAEAGSC